MDFNKWIEKIDGMAGIYAFDIMEDGSFGEIKLMGVNSKNRYAFEANPNAPEFYPGIPWRSYFTDLNFESFIYRCASTNNQLYSYVNAHGFWLKGFYLPLIIDDDDTFPVREGVKTVYCLYVGTISPQVEPEFMSQQSSNVSSAVMNISIKLHHTQDYYKDMSAAIGELQDTFGAKICMVYTVNRTRNEYELISPYGLKNDFRDHLAKEMNRTPLELAEAWEKDLNDSDCLMLDNDLSVIKERDPVWYKSLCTYDVKNIILYAVRYNHVLVGFIWAINYDSKDMVDIKKTLELTSFLFGAVISNHQFVSALESSSRIDALTQVFNRNALNARLDAFSTGASGKPDSLGIVYADLNGLKTVNDTEGHDAGDKLLSRAASVLKLAFDEYEVYRLGGDEFVILCPDITEAHLTKLVEKLKVLADTAADVSFAVGHVLKSGDYDIQAALQEADSNMYRNKEEFYRQHPDKNRRKS
ncbi:MAG: GGDEF domain-containing protein [Oscillospiraceae bacterium]|nr:GGDEF domain-containing protein [Oscillospiraceae bacterium]MBR3535641.1 GGDEF domain-containing protein [Oscillospiraceae bacterium]